ncbi:hypothetical protein HPB47_024392 [Ixodes persulcatus]|uniref:Uncharacterized protein n=1 Tax=Ixodes persulcatus TaxID=34615 RepID=A0AC60Q783_IXOPE|nr:hypothetical protein HPB47_024392 [Ixodes persulcatus]
MVLITHTSPSHPTPAGERPALDVDTGPTQQPKGMRKFCCELCSYTCYNENGVMLHRLSHARPPLLRCHVCGSKFPRFISLKRHVCSHFSLEPYQCDVCSVRFAVPADLRIHLLSHTEGGTILCRPCPEASGRESVLVGPIGSHGVQGVLRVPVPPSCPSADKKQGRDIDNSFSEKPKGTHVFGCDLCSYSCYSENRVMRHRVNHATPPHLRCHVCGDEFPLFVSLVRHVRTHFTAKPYQCDVCLARFTVSNLRDHMRTHTGERPFACGHCQKSFAQKSSLTKHLAVHTGAGVFTCHLCAQAFGDKSALKEHVASHFGARDMIPEPVPPARPNDAEQDRASPQDASVAGPGMGPPSASGKSPFRLLRSEWLGHPLHQKRRREWTVQIRQWEKTQVMEATRASRRSQGLKPTTSETVDEDAAATQVKGMRTFTCDVCGYWSQNENILMRHRRDHSGARPTQCHVCNEEFPRLSLLHQHVWTHASPRPYQCELCLARFRHRGTTVDHLRTHTGERPFLCVVCGRWFTTKTTLASHAKTHARGKSFACHLCPEVFGQKISLQTHLRTHVRK